MIQDGWRLSHNYTLKTEITLMAERLRRAGFPFAVRATSETEVILQDRDNPLFGGMWCFNKHVGVIFGEVNGVRSFAPISGTQKLLYDYHAGGKQCMPPKQAFKMGEYLVLSSIGGGKLEFCARGVLEKYDLFASEDVLIEQIVPPGEGGLYASAVQYLMGDISLEQVIANL